MFDEILFGELGLPDAERIVEAGHRWARGEARKRQPFQGGSAPPYKSSEGEVLGKCGVVPEVVMGTTHPEEVMVHMGGIPLLVVTAVNPAEDMVDTVRMVTIATTVTTVAHMDSMGDKEDGREDVVGMVDVSNHANSVQS